jgi:hypothetical protein
MRRGRCGRRVLFPRLVPETCRRRCREQCRAGQLVRVSGQSGHFVDCVAGGRGRSDFGETEIENFDVAALGDENVGGLDVAVDDAFGVRGIEGVRDLNGDVEETIEFDRLTGDDVL